MIEHSNIKGDIPFEIIKFDEDTEVFINYINEKGELSNKNGRYTAKYRQIFLMENGRTIKEKYGENPYYDEEASDLNRQWETHVLDGGYYDKAVHIIDEGLELSQIKQRVLNDEEYLVVLWKQNTAPLPVNLTMFKDITLSLIDTAYSTAELVFNVIHTVNKLSDDS